MIDMPIQMIDEVIKLIDDSGAIIWDSVDFWKAPQVALQVIQHLAVRVVNHCHQQGVPPWGYILPQFNRTKAPGLIGPLRYF
jgi:hypothetical protein